MRYCIVLQDIKTEKLILHGMRLFMKRACKSFTSKSMRISTCEFHTTIEKQIIHV
jgi:hypothetical protein